MLKDLIKSTQQLKEFTKAVRETLTPSTLLTVLTEKTITDPALVEQLNKAIGKKSKSPMTTRLADEIAASMLGFNNTHEMFAYYGKDQAVYSHTFLYTHRYGNDAITVYAPADYRVSVADLVCFASLDFEADRTDESIEYLRKNSSAEYQSMMSESEIYISSNKAGGVLVTLPSEVSKDSWDYACSVTDDVIHAQSALSELADTMDTGVFCNTGNPWLTSANNIVFFEAECGNTLAALIKPLIEALSEYKDQLVKFNPLQSCGQESQKVLGDIGLIWNVDEMWAAVYRVSDGLPIAISTIPLHKLDPRRQMFNCNETFASLKKQ